jgi:hypothetical protein
VARKVRKPTDTVQLKLRFPERLRRQLVHEAKRDQVSLNTLIITVLERELFKRIADPNAVAAYTILNSLNEDVLKKLIGIVQVELAFDDDLAGLPRAQARRRGDDK